MIFFLLFGAVYAGVLEEETFNNIEKYNDEQLVVFYHSSEAASIASVAIVERAAVKLKKEMNDKFHFRKCDGDLAVNQAGFQGADFITGTYIFTSVQTEGIVKYTGKVARKDILSLVRSKYLKVNLADTLAFSNEHEFWERMDSAPEPQPQLVLFCEERNSVCKRARKGFNVFASAYRSQVHAVEADCSGASKAWCTQQNVNKYPSFTLYTSERKVRWKSDSSEHIPSFKEYGSFVLDAVPSLTVREPGRNGKLKKKKKKVRKKSDGVELPQGKFDISED